ncbi:type I polyketide synthase [Streptomyces sp. S.PB5]|uniref:type I polyketide synthase n=1 Tax=Streptomyces sp. S.PB5 TaxID=3020844 RepID=UPI0025AF8483|nr:type I polyketide synthase [Streptomyces sp. S.PB5]MDN3021369.1 type I polyketide synthase [Streptomyces sp. S.PB5]
MTTDVPGIPAQAQAQSQAHTVNGEALRNRLAALAPAAQHSALRDLLKARIAEVADHDGDGHIDVRAPWRRLGVYRDVGQRLIAALAEATGLRLLPTTLFDYPTPEALAEHLRGELLGTGRVREGAGPAAAAGTLGATSGAGLAGAADDPVVVVGLGCRLPGGVESPEALWRLVAEGKDVIGGLPGDRGWDLEGLYDPDPAQHGTAYTRYGGFLDGVGDFDPGFFGIGPREALALDPQQRLMLEISWEAMERAGIDPHELRGSNTGVFTGVSLQDYGPAWHEAPQEAQGQMLTGNALGVGAGRIAYTYGFEGPALTIDTQCSSSLVALHVAAQSLRTGECDLALAGGVTVMSTPGMLLEFSRKRGLAPDGRCKAFSADADGTGWAEGAGIVLLERLSDARRAGRRVLAVLRASGINQDGASNGLTAPNGPSQQRLIQRTLVSAGLGPADVDAVEAHGTGTALGDPIEAGALIATYGRDRPEGRPLYLGSLKSNIGHTQAAAGVAGVIKMVMAMHHELLPRTLHVKERSPHVDWSAGDVELLQDPVPWPRARRPRRAAVSAFGVSGTNAHVIIEEPPAPPVTAVATPLPVVVSARTDAALREQAGRLGAHLTDHPDTGLLDVGATLAGRARFEHRAVVLATDVEEAAAALRATAEGAAVPNVTSGSVSPRFVDGRLAALFTGQGGQRPEMGRLLFAAHPVFARTLDEVCARMDGHLERPLGQVMFAPEGSAEAALLNETAYTQPALFAYETALFRLVESWGVVPDLLLGHSVGELTAAYVAGVWSLDDACRLVAARGRLMQSCRAGGAMAAVQATEDEVLATLAAWDGRVVVATVNGPAATVVAGDADAVEEVAALWRERGRRTKRLTVSHAFHSPHMDEMLDAFREVAAQVTYRPAMLPVISNVTGQAATDEQLCSPDYWVRHVREAVRFADGVRRLHDLGATAFLELGPDAVLTAMGAGCLPDDAVTVFAATARAGRPEDVALATALAELHVRGVDVEWPAFYEGRGAHHVDLPTYAFQRRRYWLEPATRTAALAPEPSDPAGWRYRVQWRPFMPAPTAAPPSLSGVWLLLTPTGEAERELVERVAWTVDRLGGRAVTVPVGRKDADRRRMAELLEKQIADAGHELGGVLSLLALEPTAHTDHPAVTEGLAATCALVQALADLELESPLWCVTRSAVATADDDPVAAPDQAMVWGLGRTLALERPRGWGGLIDLPAGPDDDETLLWFGVALASSEGEDQLAVRSHGLFAPRLTRAEDTGAEDAGEWRPRGTVLITGGTGALGARTARWLAAHGARRLVLVNRRGLQAPGAAQLVGELSGHGVHISVEACDMADRDQVVRLLESIPPGELTAVVHAAGVGGRFVPLTDMDLAEFADGVAAKAAGAAHLHEALGDTELDAFVVFSSVSATWGSSGQTAYAAGNAFLDGLVCHRRARGLAATSVAWGPWGEAGMGAEAEMRQFLARRGLPPMDPVEATEELGRAVASGATMLTVADVDWDRFLPPFTATRASRFFEEITPSPASSATGAPGRSDTEAPQAVRITDPLLLVRTEAAALLGHASPDEIDPSRRFLELGFDSLTSVQLRQRLMTASGLPLATPVVFEHPTPEQLARHIEELATVQHQDTAASPLDDNGLGVRGLYRRACEIGKFFEGIRVLQAAAKLRPVFTEAAEFGRTCELVRLASGPEQPALVCLPSMVAPSGPHNFGRLALHLHGRHDVYALPLPGFGDGDPLPATSDLIVEMHAEAVVRELGDTPYALAGYSSGGWLALAVAARLEADGHSPRAVVLLDTWFPKDDLSAEQVEEQLTGVAVNDHAFALMTEAQVTAQGAYLELFDGWQPQPVAAPVLLARAGERMPQREHAEGAVPPQWDAAWDFEHDTLDALGNHQTMMNEHAATNAGALSDWLRRL